MKFNLTPDTKMGAILLGVAAWVAIFLLAPPAIYLLGRWISYWLL